MTAIVGSAGAGVPPEASALSLGPRSLKVEKNEACSFDSGACCDLEEARRGEERRSSSEGGGRREEDDGDRSIDRSIDRRKKKSAIRCVRW